MHISGVVHGLGGHDTLAEVVGCGSAHTRYIVRVIFAFLHDYGCVSHPSLIIEIKLSIWVVHEGGHVGLVPHPLVSRHLMVHHSCIVGMLRSKLLHLLCHDLLLHFLLSLLLGNLREQVLLSLDEIFVAEALLVLRVTALVEAVHVQLAHEGGEIVVLEVFGEDLLSEVIRLVHYESRALGIPKHKVLVGWVLHTNTNTHTRLHR